MPQHFLYWAKFVPTDPNIDLDLIGLGTKIGITKNPFTRMTQLGGGTIVPLDVVPIKLYSFEDKKGAELAEKVLHYTLTRNSQHSMGEWFHGVCEKEISEVIQIFGGTETVYNVSSGTEGVIFDDSVKDTDVTSDKLDCASFWKDFERYRPSDIPEFNLSTYPQVLGASNEPYVKFEYCVNSSRCSVGLYIYKEANHNWSRMLIDRVQNIDNPVHSYDYKLPTENNNGYARILLPYNDRTKESTLRVEMYDAMRQFRKDLGI